MTGRATPQERYRLVRRFESVVGPTGLAGRMASFAICAVGLAGMLGCEGSATGPPSQPGPQSSTEVTGLVSTDHAKAGEEVRLEFPLPMDFVADAYAVFQATVRWDPTNFEYVGLEPLRTLQLVAVEVEEGWITVRSSDLGVMEGDLIALIFLALHDADTSGFGADASIISDPVE